MSDSGLSLSLEAPPPTRTIGCCGICLADVPSISIFKTTKQCRHSYCGHCMSLYITVKINDGVADVRCPGLFCEAMLDPVICKQLVSSTQFARWCDLLCEWSVLGFSRYYCPNSNCGEMIINDCGGDKGLVRLKCPSCKKKRLRFRNENLLLLERLAKRQQWKRCPQCKIYVARGGGCSNIVCRCGTRFCYECGEKRGSNFCACSRSTDSENFGVYVFVGALLVGMGVFTLCFFVVGVVYLVRFWLR